MCPNCLITPIFGDDPPICWLRLRYLWYILGLLVTLIYFCSLQPLLPVCGILFGYEFHLTVQSPLLPSCFVCCLNHQLCVSQTATFLLANSCVKSTMDHNHPSFMEYSVGSILHRLTSETVGPESFVRQLGVAQLNVMLAQGQMLTYVQSVMFVVKVLPMGSMGSMGSPPPIISKSLNLSQTVKHPTQWQWEKLHQNLV